MRANLAEREKLFGELVPWDHANYGMDESWVRCFPYEQTAEPGGNVACDVVVTNHSSEPREAACRAVGPSRLDRAERVDHDRSAGQDGGQVAAVVASRSRRPARPPRRPGRPPLRPMDPAAVHRSDRRGVGA